MRLLSVVFGMFLMAPMAFAVDVSGLAVCRTLRNEARIECLGKHYQGKIQPRFGVFVSSTSTSSSSSVLTIGEYSDSFQDRIGTDKNFQPAGASCVRYTDERRALCRVKQLTEGTGKSASSSSVNKVSVRRNCMRLSDAEKLKCLRESRGVIDVITRTVK